MRALAPRAQRLAHVRLLHGHGSRSVTRGTRAVQFTTAPTYPTHAESTLMASEDDRHDHNTSHLVCANCNSPISKTRDLVFFKWRGGIHMSSLTTAPLQHLRSNTHWDNEENSWKKHKLHCLKCDHTVGSIARVYSSDKILFSAREVAIQMPEHQSPMLSISGYPSSMLGFSMWSELLLMLESQPNLKSLLDIRRLDNIRDYGVEKKEINTMLLLASDLRSLFDIVEAQMSSMNHINLMTAVHRTSVLFAASKKTKPPTPTHRFSVLSEAPEDLLMDLPMHALVDPRVEEAKQKELNKRLWRLIDATEGLLNFSISAVQNAAQLSGLASSLWRLKIGRPTILQPIALQTIKLAETDPEGFTTHTLSLIATTTAHLASKDIRGEPWMRDLLFLAADAVVADESHFTDKDRLQNSVLPLVYATTLTGHYHEALHQKLFAACNAGILDTNAGRSSHKLNHTRLYQVHLDNDIAQRDASVLLQQDRQLQNHRAVFGESEKLRKNGLFRVRRMVASALESMELAPTALHTFESTGYVVDLALARQRIAIEINDDDAYLAHDPRNTETRIDTDEIEIGFRQQPYTTLPVTDLKARHLEHMGWIVVQLPLQEFMLLDSESKRIQYLSMLIETATYSRAQEIEDDELTDD